ncbi:MAG: hypothetical protein D6730_16435 [Bacteroidetes bacterium]|nr:MAG: hypothetical protein D6730_16435 [Bacteroidota bacterium]
MDHRKWIEILERSAYGILLGGLIALITLNQSILPISVLTGLSIGFWSGVLEKWAFSGWLRRRRFVEVILLRSLAYLIVIVLTLMVLTSSQLAMDYQLPWLYAFQTEGVEGISELFWRRSFITPVLVCFVLLLAMQFVMQVSRLLGRNVLLNYLIGRYYHPKEEERIFLFMDIKSSTSLAEKLGHFQWHRLLNDFFFDISEPISRTKGEIYQYVGDEVVISWPKKRGIERLNCIQCFFYCMKKIEARKHRYLKRYGTEPIFKAGLHIGKVVAGEIGDFKRSIVFHGDTINTASRIQSETNRLGLRLLLSARLLEQLDLRGMYTTDYIGEIKLRGKEEKVVLYSLDPV